MLRFLVASTARQVGWVVALATIGSNLLALVAWLLLSPGSAVPGSVRAFAAEIVTTVEFLRDVPPESRAMILQSVTRQSLQLQDADALPADGWLDSVLTRALNERLAERDVAAQGAVIARPQAWSNHGVVVTIDFIDGETLRFAIGEPRMRNVIPSLLLPPTLGVVLIGLPLLLVMLWVAYWMTRPLDRLARAASAIEAAGHQVRVPETGALEVRRLGRAINGLLERLREDVAERAKIMAGVSHDLRTPLTRLRLRVETIQDTRLRQGLGADLTLMEGIVSSSMALLEADLRQEPVEALDIAALAATICDQFVDAGFDVAYAGPLHHVIRAQPVALERALNNLVENACKHAVGARLVMAEEEGAIRIAVEDRGPGIAEADLPHVTEAFRRPLKNGNGFGLGLAIVASVARAHGGQLRLTNRSGGGLSAELRLPAMEVA